jgi:hypothetical protein
VQPERQTYKGHRIELRAREGRDGPGPETQRDAELQLLIDDERVPYGRLPDGQYALHEYAYDWSNDLMDLARRFIDYREKADAIRRRREPGVRQ